LRKPRPFGTLCGRKLPEGSYGWRTAMRPKILCMSPLDHRDSGILGEVLTESELTGHYRDGIHVAPAIVKLFSNAKGRMGPS